MPDPDAYTTDYPVGCDSPVDLRWITPCPALLFTLQLFGFVALIPVATD